MSKLTAVAFQGELGAYSEEAVLRFFGERAEPIPCRDFHDVARAVEDRRVARGLLPVENTLAGSVRPTFQILASGRFSVIGEVIIPIHHCLLAQTGVRFEELRRVYSHPVALAQCTHFLRSYPRLEPVAEYDTAGAAKRVSQEGDRSAGALAGRRAAERYGLEIVAADVEDRSDNQTRFLIVVPAEGSSTDSIHVPIAGGKTLLLARVPNRAGALLRLLEPFAEARLNLSKLETHPDAEPWTSLFFLEVEEGIAMPPMVQAIEDARRVSVEVRVLGSYARWAEPDPA